MMVRFLKMLDGRSLGSSLQYELIEERIIVVRLLSRCIRNVIADKAELTPLIEILAGTNDQDRFEIVQFFSELVKSNRLLGNFAWTYLQQHYYKVAENERESVVK